MRQTTQSILMLIGGLLLAGIMLIASCSPVKRAAKSDRAEVRELMESYYITKENPENNRPGEQDSIINLIKKEIKK